MLQYQKKTFCTDFEYFLCLQSLPRIDLDNYSALPVDEGDEDREAGIGDEEDEGEGSDLEIGDDPTGGGKPGTFLFTLVN